MKTASKLNLRPIRGTPVTENMVHVDITEDAAMAIKLIGKADFTKIQCVDSAESGLIYKRLLNFRLVRSLTEFNRFMSYYHLDSLVDSSYLAEITEIFKKAYQLDDGICVTVVDTGSVHH